MAVVRDVDSFFRRGSTHKICEDYAWSGFFNRGGGADDIGRSLVVVSDGCSTSPFTDFGARLLVRSLMNRVASWGEYINMEWLIEQAHGLVLSMKMPSDCLNATLLYALENNKGDINVGISGDGMVLAKLRYSGEWKWLDVSFSGNCPAYLHYLAHYEHLKGFANVVVGNLPTTNGDEDLSTPLGVRYCKGTLVEEIDSIPEVEDVLCVFRESDEGDFADFQDRYSLSFTLDSDRYSSVLIATDGLSSFFTSGLTRDNLQSLFEDLVIRQVTKIRSFRGEFLQRRMRKFIDKYCVDRLITHSDDVAIAGLFMPKGKSNV